MLADTESAKQLSALILIPIELSCDCRTARTGEIYTRYIEALTRFSVQKHVTEHTAQRSYIHSTHDSIVE